VSENKGFGIGRPVKTSDVEIPLSEPLHLARRIVGLGHAGRVEMTEVVLLINHLYVALLLLALFFLLRFRIGHRKSNFRPVGGPLKGIHARLGVGHLIRLAAANPHQPDLRRIGAAGNER